MNEIGNMILDAIDTMQGVKYCEMESGILSSEVIDAARSKITPYHSMHRLDDEAIVEGIADLTDIYSSLPGNVIRSNGCIELDSNSIGSAIIPGVAIMKMEDDVVEKYPTTMALTSNGGFQHVGLWQGSISTVSPVVTPVVVGGHCGPSALLVPIDSGCEPIDCAIEFLKAMSDEYYAKENSPCRKVNPEAVVVRHF